jgi:hypothetical protein
VDRYAESEEREMANTVMLGDVDTWYDEAGSGDPLVLLHPGGAGVEALCNEVIVQFLTTDPVRLMAPIRRAVPL